MTYFISLLGVISHYYDYHIIGFLVSKISGLFFPTDVNSNLAIIKTFILLYMSIALKPIGAIIFGRIGDLKGRQAVLKQSLMISGILSIIIACVPTYSTIGVFAAIILLICRIGISTVASLGTDSIRLYVYERLKRFPTLGNGIVGSTSVIGSGIASFSALFFTNPELPNYFWRFSVGLGGGLALLLALILYFYKHKLDNDNYLKLEKSYQDDSKKTLTKVIKDNLSLFLITSVLLGCFGSIYSFNTIFWTTIHATELGNNEIIKYIPYGITIYLVSTLLFCYLVDILKLKVLPIICSIVAIGFYVLLLNYIYDTDSHIKIYYCLMFALGGVVNPSVVLIIQFLPITIRQRIFSLSHSIGSITISHTNSIICISLCTYYESIKPAIIYAIVILSTILCCSIYLYKRIILESKNLQKNTSN